MSKMYVLYNPTAGDHRGEEKAHTLAEVYPEKEIVCLNITKIEDCASFVKGLDESDEIVICGGDGTLNRFVNAIYDLNVENNILYFATGSGNDFLRDVGEKEGEGPFSVNKYIKDLPTVTVNGKTYRFINGIGFGIDGYCCEVGDKIREENKKPDYTAIAIKGLLFGYKPTSAKVTVDGVTKEYGKIWIAPTMYGKYYGGGMMPAPEQDRENEEHNVSFTAMHTSGKLKTLMIFPSIFKGEHVKNTDVVDVISGKHVVVEFDRPVALQIDGETILNVTKYEVNA